MRELSYGERIKLGDIFVVDGKNRRVVHTEEDHCLVKVNSRTFIKFPIVYTEDFKKAESDDNEAYSVFRECDLRK